MRNTENIYHIALEVLKTSASKNVHSQKVATELAEKRINDILRVQSTY